MKIKEINIKSFAGLSGLVIRPEDGVNVIVGRNESGKSRICGFIKYIFYGLPEKAEDYRRLVPFGGASCSGTLTVETAKGVFRISRDTVFAEKGGKITCQTKSVQITDTVSGKEIVTERSPGEYFFGVPAHVYSSTAYIGQLEGAKTGDSALSEAATNIVFSADESVSAVKASEKLDKLRIALMHKNRKGGKIYEETEKLAELKAKLNGMSEANAEIIALTGTCEELRAKKENSEKRLSDLREFFAEYDGWNLKLSMKEREKALSERDMLLADAEKKRAAISKTGFFPDDKYLATLREDHDGMKRALLSLKDAQETERHAKEAHERISEKTDFLKKLEQRGGYDFVRDEYRNIRQKISQKLTIASLLSVFTALLLLLAAFTIAGFLMLPKTVGYISVCAGIISAAAALFVALSRSKTKNDLYDLLSPFDMEEAEFSAKLETLASDRDTVRSVLAREAAATEQKEKARANFTDAASALRFSLCLSVDAENVPDDALLDCTDETISFITEKRAVIDEITAQARNMESYADGIGEQLAKRPKEELEAAYAREYDDEALSKVNIAEKKRDLDFLVNSAGMFADRLHSCETKLSVLKATTVPAADIESEIERTENDLREDTEYLDAVLLAMETLKNSGEELRGSISPRIAAKAGDIMAELSGNRYSSLGVSQDFGLSYFDGSASRDVSYLSSGTSDMAYFALRCALVDTLFEKEKPAFIFDESFSRFDDVRLAEANRFMSSLASDGYQCILFWCNDRAAGFDGHRIDI